MLPPGKRDSADVMTERKSVGTLSWIIWVSPVSSRGPHRREPGDRGQRRHGDESRVQGTYFEDRERAHGLKKAGNLQKLEKARDRFSSRVSIGTLPSQHPDFSPVRLI